MNHCVIDKARLCFGIKYKEKSPVKILRTKIWIDQIIDTSGFTTKQIQEKISGDSEPSSNVSKWRRGERTVKDESVLKLEEQIPGSSGLYFSTKPIFELLEDKPLSTEKIDQILGKYLPLDIWDEYNFPDTMYGLTNAPSVEAASKHDLESLYRRNDFYGFMGVLYLLRTAEAENDLYGHLRSTKFAYMSLPALCRLPTFNKYWEDILGALQHIHLRVLPNWKEIESRDDFIKEQVSIGYDPTMKKHPPINSTTDCRAQNKTPYRNRYILNPSP